MRKLSVSVALSLLLVLLEIVLVGCSSTNGAVSSPSDNPGPTTSGNLAPTTCGNPAPTTQAAMSPMGAYIEEMGTGRNFYIATNDGTGLTKVNRQIGDFHSVYVLPDGSKGVFAAHAADGYSQIYYMAPVDDTIEPIQLTTTPVDKTSAMLSADGNRITFLQLDPLQQDPDGRSVWNVAVMDVSGSNLYVVPRPQGWYASHPFFSPDGQTIAVALSEGGFGGDMGVFIMTADGNELRRVTPGGADGILAVAPAFSQDGKQIVFSSLDWNDVSIYRINSDGSGLQRMGQTPSGAGDPLFVGDRIMFVANYHIHSMKADGTDATQVTPNGCKDAFEMSVD